MGTSMQSQREIARELHQYHNELDDVREKLRRAPGQLRARKAAVDKAAAALDQRKAELKDLKKLADSKELSIKSIEAKLFDLQVKLNQAKNNDEYEAIQREIAKRKEERGSLESEVLQTFDDQEVATGDIARLDQELVAEKKTFAEFEEKQKYSVGKWEARVPLLEDMLAKTLNKLDGSTVEVYRRLLKSRTGSEILAAYSNGACQACYTEVTPQAASELRSGKIVTCRSCGVLLYEGD